MSGICLAAGAIAAILPFSAFTLAWTHSIEKIRWEEDYRIVDTRPPRLQLTEARIRGSGAGMEPPDGAVLKNGVWRYRPPLAPLERLQLSHSPYVADYQLCHAGDCKSLKSYLPGLPGTAVITLAACP
ncbi:MAG: DUF1850 domain-containing protein [Betaproteobacteria bacterium]|nr:DUF1850 domain-containing protein [Betaproteobacteria bacterium]